MAKKKIHRKKFSLKSEPPEFKPADKPYLEYDGVILNANVPWHEVIADIVLQQYSLVDIAVFIEADIKTLEEVLKQNFDVLSFRAGARLITLHYRLCSACYSGA
jgi:hypothetical protein